VIPAPIHSQADIFRDPQEVYARKIVKRESDRVLVEIGANNRGWQKLATWHKWAARRE